MDRTAVAAVTWAEAGPIKPLEGGEGARRRLLETVSALILRYGPTGFAAGQSLPPVGADDAALAEWLVASGLTAAEQGASSLDGSALPAKAALLPVDPMTRRGPLGGPSSVPATAAWVAHEDAVPVALYRIGDLGAPLGLFTSSNPPGEGEAVWVSAATGTGKASEPKQRMRAAWVLGAASVLLLAWTLFATLSLGRTVGQAASLMSGHSPAQTVAYLDTLAPPVCPPGLSEGICKDAAQARATWTSREAVTAEIDRLKGQIEAPVNRDRLALLRPALAAAEDSRTASNRLLRAFAAAQVQGCQASMAAYARPGGAAAPVSGAAGATVTYCEQAWIKALDHARRHLVNRFPGGALFEPFAASAVSSGVVSLSASIALMMIGIVAFAISIGWAVTGKLLGALLNNENRYSLSVAQVAAWTVVVLGGFIAYSSFNTGMLSEVASGVPPVRANDAVFVVYPTIPFVLLSALGISFASPMLSVLINGQKNSVGDETLGLKDASTDEERPALVRHASKANASLADLFVGETVETHDRVAISRLQMIIITAGLLTTYGHLVFAQAASLTAFDLLGVFQTAGSLTSSLPKVAGSFIALLAISHASYLVPKAAEGLLKPK